MAARFSIGLLLALFIALMVLALRDASAATRITKLSCGPHDELVGLLGKKYSEHRTGFGVSGKHFVVETFRSTDGSFTVLKTDRKGLSCIMASGHSWEKLNVDLDPKT